MMRVRSTFVVDGLVDRNDGGIVVPLPDVPCGPTAVRRSAKNIRTSHPKGSWVSVDVSRDRQPVCRRNE